MPQTKSKFTSKAKRGYFKHPKSHSINSHGALHTKSTYPSNSVRIVIPYRSLTTPTDYNRLYMTISNLLVHSSENTARKSLEEFNRMNLSQPHIILECDPQTKKCHLSKDTPEEKRIAREERYREVNELLAILKHQLFKFPLLPSPLFLFHPTRRSKSKK